MADIDIECPHCHKTFKLNEMLAAPLVEETRRKLRQEIGDREQALEERGNAVAEQEKAAAKARKEVEKERAALATQKEEMDERVAEMVEEQRVAIARDEAKKAKEKYEEKLAERDEEKAELEEQLEDKKEQLAEARKQEVELRRKQRELDDKLEAADVEVEKRVNNALGPMREKAKQDAVEEHRFKLAEKDKIIQNQKRQLADAQRKLEQGSQQLQGEVAELDLEQVLTNRFPFDSIEPIAKGVKGADVLQRVRDGAAQECGSILWESKRAKNWSENWLTKLRSDQREAKADIAIIVPEPLPQGVTTIDSRDGVIIVARQCIVPVGMLVRQQVIEVSCARQTGEGQKTKMELLYEYLMGPQFRHRVEAIVEAFTTMQDDLAKEKRSITKQWAKREKQIEIVTQSTVGMWGDLQGIAGKTLQEIEGLDVPLLEEGTTAEE